MNQIVKTSSGIFKLGSLSDILWKLAMDVICRPFTVKYMLEDLFAHYLENALFCFISNTKSGVLSFLY